MLYKKGFISILAASVLFFSVSVASAQFEDAKAASDFVVKSYDEIVNQYLVTGTPMPTAVLEQYKADLITSRDIKRFRQTLEADAKLKLNLCKAMLEYFEGDKSAAASTAYRVYTAASNDTEVKNCVIFMGYMTKEFSYIKKMLNQDEDGKAAIEPVGPSNARLSAEVAKLRVDAAKAAALAAEVQANAGSAVSNDPNSLSDPNSPASIAARNRQRQQNTANANDMFNNRNNQDNDPFGRTTATAGKTGPFEFDLSMMPVDMLGSEIGQLNLETVNGGYVTYAPNSGKALCMLLWVCDDKKVGKQVAEMDKLFTQTGGGYGPVQYLALNCNQTNEPEAIKLVFEQVVKYPALAAHCMMSPANSSQLKGIEPASGVVAIAGSDGIIRYVGPADTSIANAIIMQESAAGSSEMAAFVSTPSINPAIDAAVAQTAVSQAAKQGGADDVVPYQEDAPKQVDLGEDPTIHQARQKLDLARTKMRIQFGISFKSALDLCDEILEGWPGTQEAEEAKEIISTICSKNAGRVYRKQRIAEGKYVGEENEGGN